MVKYSHIVSEDGKVLMRFGGDGVPEENARYWEWHFKFKNIPCHAVKNV